MIGWVRSQLGEERGAYLALIASSGGGCFCPDRPAAVARLDAGGCRIYASGGSATALVAVIERDPADE